MSTQRTFIDLEFNSPADNAAPLGDIATSLVSLHDLLRDLGAMAAYQSGAEFREIQVVGIEMRRPLTIKLSLLAIPPEAVEAFQEICRDIILFRERQAAATNASAREALLDRVLPAEHTHVEITDRERERLHGHITVLRNARVPLTRVAVTSAG